MLRGIDKRNIFLDESDKARFKDTLLRVKVTAGFQLFGYCLMDNHVHLLLQESESLGTSVKRVAVSYALWHNAKHGRIGHLFQNRYLSEPVETESYLLTALRYIHQNPVKAFMVDLAKDYPWSSHGDYQRFFRRGSCAIDADWIRAYFKSLREYELYIETANEDQCLDYHPAQTITDAELAKVIAEKYGHTGIAGFLKMERDAALKELYCQSGASIRQIARVAGIGISIVASATKKG